MTTKVVVTAPAEHSVQIIEFEKETTSTAYVLKPLEERTFFIWGERVLMIKEAEAK